MFITTLTKNDWFRIFKYLWKTNCMTYPYFYFVKAYLFSLDIIAVYFLYDFLRTSLTSDFISLAIIIGIRLVFPSIIFWLLFSKEIIIFWKVASVKPPHTLITFENTPTDEILHQVKQRYPTALINRSCIFSPPLNNKWDLLIFEDYYLLYTHYRTMLKGKKKRLHVILPIKQSDISDTTRFIERLETFCQRKIDLSDIKLHN